MKRNTGLIYFPEMFSLAEKEKKEPEKERENRRKSFTCVK